MNTTLDITIELSRDEGTSLMVLLLLLDSKRDQLTTEQEELLDSLQGFLRGRVI